MSTEKSAVAEELAKMYERMAEIRDWAKRHAEHAGRAPLSELQDILNGR
jgi:hypothetical protein